MPSKSFKKYLLPSNKFCLINFKTMAIKNSLFLLLFLVSATGCGFQKPDYLATVTPAELNRIMHNEDVLLVDVHTPEQRHIKGTDFFIPYDQIEKYKDKLPQDKNTAIYLYCKSGPMANKAARFLYESGYRNLTNLEGGAEAWKKAGLDFE